MDTTYQHYLDVISKSGNKKHWRVRNATKMINLDISGYRLTAMQNPGTNLARFCNQNANWLEKQVKMAMECYEQ